MTTAQRPGFSPILFDLDGTLTDSAPGILACLREALASVGHPGLPPEILAHFLGPPLVDTFTTYAQLSPDEVTRAIAAYRRRYARGGMYENSVYPGMADLLERLTRAGAVLAVATSKPEVVAERILDHFDLARHFAVIVGAEPDSRRSAKAEVVAEALRRLEPLVPPHMRAIMVGDREHDVKGARANGLGCIGVAWGYGEPGELSRAGAVAIPRDADELGRLLLG